MALHRHKIQEKSDESADILLGVYVVFEICISCPDRYNLRVFSKDKFYVSEQTLPCHHVMEFSLLVNLRVVLAPYGFVASETFEIAVIAFFLSST